MKAISKMTNNNPELENLIDDFIITSQNALSMNWIISPLDYFWIDGKKTFDKVFHTVSTPSIAVDEQIAQILFRNLLMQVNFRAKFMVAGYMIEPHLKKFSLEIEQGFLSFYSLDFISTITNWIFVFEGVIRELFGLSSQKDILKFDKWTTMNSDDNYEQKLLDIFTQSLQGFVENILFKSVDDKNLTVINRHILSHGKVYNKAFYNQANALRLVFALDSLLMIEMIQNQNFPKILNTSKIQEESIVNRTKLYQHLLKKNFDDYNLLKVEVLKEHLEK